MFIKLDEQKAMTRNEIENRLLEKAEYTIHKEKADGVLFSMKNHFRDEQQSLEELFLLKHQVVYIE